jgi:hypothetical protein
MPSLVQEARYALLGSFFVRVFRRPLSRLSLAPQNGFVYFMGAGFIRPSSLPVRGMLWTSRVGQAILPAAAFQAALRTSRERPPLTIGFLCLVSFNGPRRSPRNSSDLEEAGCSQDWLPHELAKAVRFLERSSRSEAHAGSDETLRTAAAALGYRG